MPSSHRPPRRRELRSWVTTRREHRHTASFLLSAGPLGAGSVPERVRPRQANCVLIAFQTTERKDETQCPYGRIVRRSDYSYRGLFVAHLNVDRRPTPDPFASLSMRPGSPIVVTSRSQDGKDAQVMRDIANTSRH
jgi:hypothetical protein